MKIMIDGYADSHHITHRGLHGLDLIKNETVNLIKRNPAGLIWANVMARIHSGLETAKFQNLLE